MSVTALHSSPTTCPIPTLLSTLPSPDSGRSIDSNTTMSPSFPTTFAKYNICSGVNVRGSSPSA